MDDSTFWIGALQPSFRGRQQRNDNIAVKTVVLKGLMECELNIQSSLKHLPVADSVFFLKFRLVRRVIIFEVCEEVANDSFDRLLKGRIVFPQKPGEVEHPLDGYNSRFAPRRVPRGGTSSVSLFRRATQISGGLLRTGDPVVLVGKNSRHYPFILAKVPELKGKYVPSYPPLINVEKSVTLWDRKAHKCR